MKYPTKYDEQVVLSAYIRGAQGVWTQLERDAYDALLARNALAAIDGPDDKVAREATWKFERIERLGIGQIRDQLLVPRARLDDDRINRLLHGGEESFWTRLCERVKHDEEIGEISLNRCPACQRILRTEAAKQCLWCGHDWH